MKDRIRTLLLEANGLTWKAILADTAIRGILRMSPLNGSPYRLSRSTVFRSLLGDRNESLSYVIDWREAFCDAPELDVDVCNISNLVAYNKYLGRITEYPLVVILHSATGDSMSLLLKTVNQLNRRRGKLVVFVGNEYNLMVEKLDFIRLAEAEYVCSQLPVAAARWLYSDCTHSQIVPMPHALNPKLYTPGPDARRITDIGFAGDFYHALIGDVERTNLIRFFEEQGNRFGFVCDIQARRFPRVEWAHFLRCCKGVLGAESGSYYLDKTGQVLEHARRYVRKHPDAGFEDVYKRFFKGQSAAVSGKAISSRHFEPVGTKTCQILIEGTYNEILVADEHYIRVRKDLSNIDEAIYQFRDEGYRKVMVNKTYEYVMDGHTYRHRVSQLLSTIGDKLN
jgi:hypothetical protein